MVLDSNFHKTLQLNNITGGTFFLNINSDYLLPSAKTLQNLLRVSGNDLNSTALKIGGVHIFLSNPKEDSQDIPEIINEIRETTEFGVAVGSTCVHDVDGVHPGRVKWIQNASYIVVQAGEILDFRLEEKQYLQGVLDSILICKKRLSRRFPKLQRIYFRQILLLKKEEERTSFLEIARYVRRQFFGNEFGKIYNVSNFIGGFDRREYFQTGYAQNGWFKISNYSDLSDSSVFSDRQSLYFNEQSWKPYSGSQATPEILEEEPVEEPIRWNVIIPSGAAVTVFIGLLLHVFRLHQLKKRDHRFLTRKEVREFYEGTVLENSLSLQATSGEQDILNEKFSRSYEIPKSEMKLNNYRHILGSGNFGMVYEAEVRGTRVAVKVPRDNCTKETFRSILCEVKILSYLGNHPNLIEFVGCCTKEIEKGKIYIIAGLCELGSLLNHLRNQVKEVSATTRNVPKLDELMRFAIEIASGMDYIGGKNVVHGDLSTRNVLLDQNFTCKIGDFGLSRKLYEYSEYIKTSQEPLPWRWMAYESLLKMEFTSKSDVWSYGVTLWEIFSLGAVPYPGLAWTTHFVDDLRNGLRLDSPEHATQDVYLKMSSCWELEAGARPNFNELREFFLRIRNQLIYIELRL